MAKVTDGSIIAAKEEYVGQTYQRTTSSLADLWLSLNAGDVVETATTYQFGVHGYFRYTGYDNFVPLKVGYVALDENNNTYIEDYLWAANLPGQSLYNTPIELSQTFTLTKPSYKVGIVPYVAVGCVNRWGDDGIAGNFWKYGYSQGIMIMSSDATGSNSYYTSKLWTLTHNNNTQTLQCYTLAGNTNALTEIYSYENASAIVQPAGGLFIANSSGTYTRASKVYVYNSSGVPKLATTVTIYDSSGNPHTVLC